MERYVCIHGHFYQPPRENPWLEAVELQDSAYPFHDWNERITRECYAPNGASRVLDGEGQIAQIVNNYARISFTFGPTLLSWMEENSPETFSRADIPDVIRTLDRGFGRDIYTLKSLFRDEQRKILNQILGKTLGEVEAVYRQVYEQYAPLMRFLSDLKAPFPKSFQTAAEFTLNSSLRRALEAEELNLNQIRSLLEEAQVLAVPLDGVSLGYSFKGRIEQTALQFQSNPKNISLLQKLDAAVGLARSLLFPVDFWRVQNIYHGILQMTYPEFQRKAENGEGDAQTWVGQFTALGEKLHCRIV
jgi:alpha-amylase/alpha-mannosidase (GH57 family)